MKTLFQRITTSDGLELHGLLCEPKQKTNKAIVHIHGWIGNFYENEFIEKIAQETVKKGFAFLTFNNRGNGIVTDLIKRKESKVEYVRIGGSLEKFEECIFDIKAALDFLSKKGHTEIVLEGHSLGCQKSTYYLHKTYDKRIKGLILLAPVDDVCFAKNLLKDKYQKALKIAKEMGEKNMLEKSVPDFMAFYPLLNAKMFLSIADHNSSSGKIFYYNGELKEVSNLACPVLAIFGSKDQYQSGPNEKLQILKEKIKNCDTKLINNADHGFVNFEDELSKVIGNWLKTK